MEFINSLVSVIIPMYNSAEYIETSINSILNQTYENIEIIVINDGSSDDSLAIVESFTDKKIKIFSQSNKGASAARNLGLKIAKGKYIQFLDADDFLSYNKIEEQVKALSINPDKIAVCKTIYFFDGEEVQNKIPTDQWYYDSFDDPSTFLIKLYGGYAEGGGMIQTNSWLTPKKIIDKAGFWDEKLSVDDDGEFFCRVIMASGGIIYADGFNYYRKYKNKKGLSSQSDYNANLSIYNALILKKKHLLFLKDDVGYKKAFARAFKRLAIQTYPNFRKISKECMNHLRDLGGSDHDVKLGGELIEKIKKIFGWKVARILQFLSRTSVNKSLNGY